MMNSNDSRCTGRVRLETRFRGTEVGKEAMCEKKPAGHAGPCEAKLVLLTVFGVEVQVAVSWRAEPVAGPVTPPPPRPST